MHELECHCWRANDRNARLQEGVAEFFANARPELEGWKDALLSRDDLFASSAITVGMGSVHAQLMLVTKGMDGPDGVSKASAGVRLLPIRPRSRGARRSLRTFPVVTLHPRFPFHVRLTGKTFD